MNRSQYHAERRTRRRLIDECNLLCNPNSKAYHWQAADRERAYATAAVARINAEIKPARDAYTAGVNSRWGHLQTCLRAAARNKQDRARIARETAKLRPTGNGFRDAVAHVAVSWGGQTAAQAVPA